MTAVLLVSCGRDKTPHGAPARHLYVGKLFRAARRAADADGRPWFIVSALHGLVHPDTVLDPYDVYLDRRNPDPHVFARLVERIRATAHVLADPTHVEVWASSQYAAAVRAAGVPVHAEPLARLGTGQRLRWFANHRAAHEPTTPLPLEVP